MVLLSEMPLINSQHKSLLKKASSDPALQDSNGQRDGKKRSLVQPTKSAPPPSTKSVRFAAKREVFFRTRRHERVAVAGTLWYNDEEFQYFKSTYNADAKDCARSKSLKNDVFIHTFEKCLHEEEIEVELLKNLYICLEDGCRTGLERFSSRDLFRDKKTRRRQMYEVVEEIENLPEGTRKQKEALLRISCEKISKTSKTFARVIAQGAI